MDISEARHLVIDCIDIYLKEINGSEEIRPYLHNYPFTVENIEIIITGPDREKEDSLFIDSISVDKGEIVYFAEKNKTLEMVLLETYDEALKKFKEDQEQLNKNPSDAA